LNDEAVKEEEVATVEVEAMEATEATEAREAVGAPKNFSFDF